jgi:hypothetical protein
MKQLYILYITRHPLALSRLAALTAPVHASHLSLPHPTAEKSSSISSTDRNPVTNGNATHYTTATANTHKGMDLPHPMQKYLATTRMLTERHTNAWDLPSLLIKVRLVASSVFHFVSNFLHLPCLKASSTSTQIPTYPPNSYFVHPRIQPITS